MLSLTDVRFSFPGGFSLRVPQLRVGRGEALALIGPSGSGKTTLLNLVAGILRPTTGSVIFCGDDLAAFDDQSMRRLRLTRFGLVFQEFELLEYLRVIDNVLLPFRLADSLSMSAEVQKTAGNLLQKIGLAGKVAAFPRELSQGERQRVALCRALVTRPELILADEPTGNLDPGNKGLAMDFLFDYVRANNASLITVTHDHQLIERFDQVVDFQKFTAQPEVAA